MFLYFPFSVLHSTGMFLAWALTGLRLQEQPPMGQSSLALSSALEELTIETQRHREKKTLFNNGQCLLTCTETSTLADGFLLFSVARILWSGSICWQWHTVCFPSRRRARR